MKNSLFFVLITSLSLRIIACNAQEKTTASFSITQYTDENGLPQNSIKGIVADVQGFIWLATEGGLVRFDGQRFYTFSKQNGGLPTKRVYGFQLSLDDSTQYGANPTTFYGIINEKYALKLHQSVPSLDSFYMAQRSQLPFWTNYEGNTFVSTGLPLESEAHTRMDHCIILLPNGKGCYVCHRQSVAFYTHGKKSYQTPVLPDNHWTFFTLGQTLYRYTQNGVVSRIDRSGSTPCHLEGDITRQDDLDQNHGEIYWNPVANQAFLYSHKRLYALTSQKNGHVATRLLLEGFDFKEKGIEKIYYDALGQRLFLGTLTQGLFVLTPKPFQTLTVPGDRTQNVMYAQTPFGTSQVLTPTGLVLGRDGQTGAPAYTQLPSVRKANVVNDKYSLLIDQTGCIWLKQGHTLVQLDAKGERSLRSWDIGDEIWTIYQGPQGGPIWIGTKYKGIFRINPSDPTARPERVCSDSPPLISYFQLETPRRLWVGTQQGLYSLDVATRQLHLIPGTQALFIRSVYVPRPDEVWFTTYEDGFFLYQARKLTHFPLDVNQYLATSHYIFEDRRGYFWLPTNKGLFQVARQELMNYVRKPGQERPYYHYYAKDQGFLTNEFNGGGQPGMVRLKNGYVSIPSLRGLVWFMPEQLMWPAVNPTILIDRVDANDKLLSVRGDTVHLPLEPQQVHIQLSTPFFDNLTNLHLDYRLANEQPSDKPFAWVSLNSQLPTIQLSSLASGTHTLVIRKANGFGANPFTYKTLLLVVPPLWYERSWILVVGLVLVGAAFYSIMQLRFRYILRKNRQLEVMITKRTEEVHLTLSQLKESEQELNRQLHLQSRLMASIAHDIQSPLQFVTNAAGQLSDLLPHNANYALREITETIAGTTSTISSLLKELLSYTKAKVYERRKENESIPLQALVENRYEIFRSILRVKNITFMNEVPGDCQVNSDSLLLGIIIHNLIDNATKHTENGHIRVYVSQISGKSHLVIANTSTAMAPNIMGWFNQVDADNESVTNLLAINKSGVGLLIVKEMAALIKVRVFVEQTQTTDVHLIFSEPTQAGFTDA
ncbi:ligand-binding sensor domain-containing protein [Spirosoma jeollabukense]